jgi:hypothetical protein
MLEVFQGLLLSDVRTKIPLLIPFELRQVEMGLSKDMSLDAVFL